MFGRRERKTPLKREPDELLEGIRDDCVALFLNSGLNFIQVHEAGGPTPQTTSKWLHKETFFVRMATVQSLLKAVGGTLSVTGQKTADQLAGRSQMSRLNIPLPTPPKMDMIEHRKRQKQHRVHRNRSKHRISANADSRS